MTNCAAIRTASADVKDPERYGRQYYPEPSETRVPGRAVIQSYPSRGADFFTRLLLSQDSNLPTTWCICAWTACGTKTALIHLIYISYTSHIHLILISYSHPSDSSQKQISAFLCPVLARSICHPAIRPSSKLPAKARIQARGSKRSKQGSAWQTLRNLH